MSEAPERIEREMFEIRSRMASDVVDLRQHVDPKVVGERVKQTLRQRLQGILIQARLFLENKQQEVMASAKNQQQEIVASAKHQAELAQEAGRKRDPSLLTDAVRSDPKPLVLLAVSLAVVLTVARRITNGRG